MKLCISFSLLFTVIIASAQLPKTDLYMLTILNNGEKITMKDPVYISGFNPDGYNNQPYFINPRELYVTTNLYDKQYTDFVRLDLQNEEYYRVTKTDSISEFSPTPKAPDSYFSAVRIEKDGKSQSLWLYPENHQSYGKRVLTDLNNIGYHCWLSEEEVALFLVDEPMKLAIGNIEENSSRIVLENIGRCFRQDSDGNLIFIHQTSAETGYIKSYDAESNKATILANTLEGSQDFELLNDGTLIMAKGSKIYALNPTKNKSWIEIIDLSEFDIFNISRLAVSRNKLVIVDNPK